MSSDYHFLVSGSHISKEPNDRSLFHLQRHEGAKKTLEQIEQLQKNHINPVIDDGLTLMDVARTIKNGHIHKYLENKDNIVTQIEDLCLSCLGLQTNEDEHQEILQIYSRIQEGFRQDEIKSNPIQDEIKSNPIQDEKKTYLINGIKINRSQVDKQTTVFRELHPNQSSHLLLHSKLDEAPEGYSTYLPKSSDPSMSLGVEFEDLEEEVSLEIPLIQNPERMTFAECLKQYPDVKRLINKDNALNLYLMAQFYDVKGLMQECGEILKLDFSDKINALKTGEVLEFLEEHYKEFAKSGIEDKHFFDDEIIQGIEQKRGYHHIPLEDRISILKSDFMKRLTKENPEFAKKLALMCFKPERIHRQANLYNPTEYELHSYGSPIECYEMVAGLEIPELYAGFLTSIRLYNQNQQEELREYALKNKIPELYVTLTREVSIQSNLNKVLIFVLKVPKKLNHDDLIGLLNENKNHKICSFGVLLTDDSDPLDKLMTYFPNELFISSTGLQSKDLGTAVKLINDNKINNLMISEVFPPQEVEYKDFINKINGTKVNIKLPRAPTEWNIISEYVSLIERNPSIKTLELDFSLRNENDAKLLGEALSKREPFDLVLKPCSDMATYNAFVASLGENASKWEKLCQDIRPK